jgi:phosphatidylserine/phosphatidylglycerophosphate/cardiolipin synthase-like enzyme
MKMAFPAIIFLAGVLLLGYFGLEVGPQGISIGCKHTNPYYQNYFCPEDGCDLAVLQQIEKAETSIYVAMYSFTLEEVADSLIDAKQRGVDVRVVLDEQQAASQYSVYEKLLNASIDVIIDKNSDYMHNKFAVIDGKIVITGSYNWTKHATEGNDENLIIITSEELAASYEAEFQELYF